MKENFQKNLKNTVSIIIPSDYCLIFSMVSKVYILRQYILTIDVDFFIEIRENILSNFTELFLQ